MVLKRRRISAGSYLNWSTAGSLQCLWFWILACIRDTDREIGWIQHGNSSDPKVQDTANIIWGFHIHFARGLTGWVADARGIYHSVPGLTYVWAKPSCNSVCPHKMHIGYVLEERSLLFPQNMNNGFNNNPKRLFLIALISSIKLFKIRTIFFSFLLLCFSSCLGR